MILKSGFFHADPHPGNILICDGPEASHIFLVISWFALCVYWPIFPVSTSWVVNIVSRDQVALLDYGQVKELSDNLRLGYANLVIDIADNNASRVAQSFR